MKDSFYVKDEFCQQINLVRDSALQSGFGTWRPNKGEVGSSVYEGMNFVGRHDLMLRSLQQAVGRPVFPSATFFRVTKPDTEGAYVHSDRMHGDWTAIVYLSEHKETSGTGFYRHRATGLIEMPTFDDMKKSGIFEQMKGDMERGEEADWEQLDFVRGILNRALIFRAPLFHARCPRHGLGAGDDQSARMVWVCHFYV